MVICYFASPVELWARSARAESDGRRSVREDAIGEIQGINGSEYDYCITNI